MRKTASCASYSEFRKKTPNLNEARGKEGSSLIEIDEMSKQLEAIGATKRKAGIEEKYFSSNAIMEVEEDQSPHVRLAKKNVIEANKDKKMANKNIKFQLPVQKKTTNNGNKNNKSFDSSIHNKKTLKEEFDKNSKTQLQKNPHYIRTNQKKPIIERRGSLKTSEQPSLMSTWSSVDSSRNLANEEEKQKIYELVQRISEKMGGRIISSEAMEQILQKLDSVDKILDSC